MARTGSILASRPVNGSVRCPSDRLRGGMERAAYINPSVESPASAAGGTRRHILEPRGPHDPSPDAQPCSRRHDLGQSQQLIGRASSVPIGDGPIRRAARPTYPAPSQLPPLSQPIPMVVATSPTRRAGPRGPNCVALTNPRRTSHPAGDSARFVESWCTHLPPLDRRPAHHPVRQHVRKRRLHARSVPTPLRRHSLLSCGADSTKGLVPAARGLPRTTNRGYSK
jgi:hypothetical protein